MSQLRYYHGYPFTSYFPIFLLVFFILIDSYSLLSQSLLHGSLSGEHVDLVLSCVDNYGARITINSLCTKHNITWMESGVSEDAMSGHIQVMMPGRTACFQCVPPLAIASNMDERQIKRNGVCTAFLPTTMSIIAGFLAQNALKYLLRFGQLVYFQGYQSLTNFFPTYIIRPSVDCCNPDCRHWQSQYPSWSPEKDEKIVRDENEQNKENAKTCCTSDDFGGWEVTYPIFFSFVFALLFFTHSFPFLLQPSFSIIFSSFTFRFIHTYSFIHIFCLISCFNPSL